MSVDKITNPPSLKAVIDKINQVIDNLGGSSSVEVDGDTISLNNDDELQAIALIDSRDSTPRPIWTGTRAQYNALQSIDENIIYNVTDDDDSNHINIVRSLGEIITSTIPLVDSGLHLLDGSLLYETGAYKEFVDYMIELYGDGTNVPNYFCTEQEWQTAVTTYGVCGKFVYDSVNNTLRLPKITGIIEGTTDVTALGNLVEAGLPSHTHTRGTMNITGGFGTEGGNWSGAFYNAGNISTGFGATGGSSDPNVIFDASRSWTGSTSTPNYVSLVSDTTTVQPQTIKTLYYIVVATVAKTDIEVDIDEIATDLNGKADVDLTNVTSVADILMAHNAMPSDTYTDLTLGASGTTYTAPADGWYMLSLNASGASYLYLQNFTGGILSGGGMIAGYTHQCFVPVSKGDTIRVSYGTITNNDKKFQFIYAQGSESEAS